MDKHIGRRNITFGWSWLFVGILMAMAMGLVAFHADWMGGYASLPRRFLRLAHISFMALSLANVLYGLCLDTVDLPERARIAGSYSMIIAAIFMPVLCLLSMFYGFFQLLFFIPALSFATAVFIMAFGASKEGSQ